MMIMMMLIIILIGIKYMKYQDIKLMTIVQKYSYSIIKNKLVEKNKYNK
jgi:hypothetical protein